jgi:O-antigen ligase
VLPLWLVLAGGWSASRLVAAERLRDVVVLGPAMLAAGLLLGGEPRARAALVGVTLLGGALVVLGLAARPFVPAQLKEPVNYQMAGLALAAAATLAALRAAEARGPLALLFWLALASGFALVALLPGGRMALLALALCAVAVPGLRLALAGRTGAAVLWVSLAAGCVAAALVLVPPLLHLPGLRTLERMREIGPGLEVRGQLWAEALRWAGAAMPWGLGTGGFSVAAGFGEQRGFYPHNHALEALAEGGLPGLLLWLAAFGGGALVALRGLRRVEPGRAARILALTAPVALSLMVSSDLGNRMAWFALGLALSLHVESRDA